MRSQKSSPDEVQKCVTGGLERGGSATVRLVTA